MRRVQLSAAVLLTLVAGCADPAGAPLTAPVRVTQDRDEGTPQNFHTHLASDNEVPAHGSLAQGNAKFQLSKDGESIEYKLIASNIDNAFMAHIHLAPAGRNGGIVVWLFGTPPGVVSPESQVRHDGVLAEGTITKANFVGALAGKSMEDLLANIRSGNAYVNVHTRDLTRTAADTAVGNFPGGEVRGQLGNGNGMP